MSLSYQPLQPVLVLDPRSKIDSTREYAVLKCGTYVNHKPWTSTSVSTASINFSTPPPSGNIIMDRKVTFTLPMRLTFTATVQPGFSVFNPNGDAPRAFPIHSMLESIQLSINNASVSQNMAEMIHALLRFNTDRKLLAKDYSETASCLDSSQSYNDLIGNIRNPLTSFGDSNLDDVIPRGGFSGYNFVSNPVNNTGVPAQLTGVVDIIATEQLMISPLYWGGENASGFINVTSNDWVFNFVNQGAANRAWSHVNDGNSVINGTSIQFNNFSPAFSYDTFQPYLNITYITPDPTISIVNPQMPYTYPYFDVKSYFIDSSPIAYPNSAQLITNNIQLSSIPRRMYVYCRVNNSDYYSSPTITDTFYGIKKISMQFNNQSGLFANATQYQLYEIAKKNHCNLSWSEWSGQGMYPVGGSTYGTKIGGVGSICCFEFASDIGLSPDQSPGLGSSSYNLQIQATVENIDPSGEHDLLGTSLIVVIVSEGSFTITQLGAAQSQQSILTQNNVLDAKSSPFIDYYDVQDINGGNFMSGLKRFGTKVSEGASKANKFLKDNKVISRTAKALSYIPEVGDIARPVSDIARVLGYGDDELGGVVVGGRKMTKSNMKKQMTKSQLERRLMKR